MENPYWHHFVKAHQIELEEIKHLVFEIYNIVSASIQLQGDGMTEEHERAAITATQKLHFEMAETVLSKRMLQLALLIRTLDDVMDQFVEPEQYRVFRATMEKEFLGFGAVFEGDDSITNSIRECCNKIIHAQDFRPVYETNDERDDPNVRWGMVGSIEIRGRQGKKDWWITLNVFDFLEGALKLAQFAFPGE
jgi:hypothetical protein